MGYRLATYMVPANQVQSKKRLFMPLPCIVTVV